MIDSSKLVNVPKKPGIYLWKNKTGKVIYVGKTKCLQKRMRQYCQKNYDVRRMKFINAIESFSYIITNNEKEAFILELNLIKKYAPEFNVLLQDNKRYPFIRIKLGKILSIKIVRKINNDGAFYYGPFPTGYGALNVYKMLVHLTMYKKGILYTNQKDNDYWKNSFQLCKEILKPNNTKFKKILELEMKEAAGKMQYEVANDLKKAIKSLDFYVSNSDVEFLNHENTDVIGIVEKDGFLALCIMFYRYGKLLSKIDKILEIKISIKTIVEQFILQFYESNITPDKLIIDAEYLKENPHIGITILNPKKGKYRRALEIAITNTKDNLEVKLLKYFRKVEMTTGAIEKLGNLLNIPKPHHILMIDNSNLNNMLPVSAIVSYKNGVKQKNEYRKFNLKTRERKADVDYIEQALERYFVKHDYPDLMLIDGGLPQLSAAKKIIEGKTHIACLVKNDKHQFRAIINQDKKEIMIKDRLLKNFLIEMQEEVDRFAKQHFRQKFLKNSLDNHLNEIKGMGDKTIAKLLKKFKTYSNIYNASQKELEIVVSTNLAKEILKKFKLRK